MLPQIFQKIQWKGKIRIISLSFSYLTLEKVETKHEMSKLLWEKSLNIIFTERLSFLNAVQLKHSNLFLSKEFEWKVKLKSSPHHLVTAAAARMLSETDWECLLPKVSRLVCEDEVSGLAVNKRFIICQVSCDWSTQLISDWSIYFSSGSSPRSPSSPAPTSSWCGCWRATSTGARYVQILKRWQQSKTQYSSIVKLRWHL